jgi:exopolysaccharide biosynthesis polyprenyl glycosylphosphotransferase
VLIDLVIIGGAFAIAYWLRFNVGLTIVENADPAFDFYRSLAFVFTPLLVILYYWSKLYNPDYLFVGLREYTRVIQINSLATVVFVGITFFAQSYIISRGWIVFSWIVATLFVLIERFAMRRLAYALRHRGYLRTTALVVGADAEGRAIASQLMATPTCGVEVVGFLDDQVPSGEKVDGLTVLGTVSAIQSIVARLRIEEIMLSMSALTRPQAIKIYEMYAQSEVVTLRFSPGLLELFTTGAFVKEWGSVPLVTISKVRLSDTEVFLKRCLDISVALCALIVLSPLLILIAILIAFDSPGPLLHRRYVFGQGGRLFDALKFRTMYVDGAEILEAFPHLREELNATHKLKDDPRVTMVGRILRRYSLDELPQLFNVLTGDMSLVGPRMITRPEQEKYGKMRLNLFAVKPGITGLWQTSGRSDLSYEERVRIDMYYIRNYSLWLDLMIILKTVPAVLRGHGAY